MTTTPSRIPEKDPQNMGQDPKSKLTVFTTSDEEENELSPREEIQTTKNTDSVSRQSIDPPAQQSMRIGYEDNGIEIGDEENTPMYTHANRDRKMKGEINNNGNGDVSLHGLPPMDDSDETEIPTISFLPKNDEDNKPEEEEDEVEYLDLEEDTYTLLLVTKTYGVAFWLALFICAMQVSLLGSILEQMLSKTGPNSNGAFLNIPFAVEPSVHLGQFIAIIFGLLTQRDLLGTVPLLIALWAKHNWSQLNRSADSRGVLRSNERLFWWEKVFVTYFLRLGVSLLTLFTAFILIIQSTNIIDLVKDFTALYIVSELDDYAFLAIKDGYFGHIFKDEIKRIKDTKIKERDSLVSCFNKPVPTQSIAVLVLFNVMFGSWLSFLVKQKNGQYFKEVHRNCNIIDDDKSLNYLSWGDGTCDPKLFTEGCGLDGGDCINECTTYFQFSVPQPYPTYEWTEVPSEAGAVTVDLIETMTYPYDDVLYEQLLKEYNCTSYEFCEGVSKDCDDSTDLFDFISNCFSDKTIYENEEELFFCWYGVDSITLPSKQKTRTRAKVGKIHSMNHVVMNDISLHGFGHS